MVKNAVAASRAATGGQHMTASLRAIARVLSVVALLGCLAVAQAVIAGTPAPVEGAPGLSYTIKDRGPRSAVLVLHGTRTIPTVLVVPLSEYARAMPMHSVSDVGRGVVSIRMQYLAGPGSYRLAIPGSRPFGLVNVGR
jgi:small ligand-binding sensory domain FIST